MAPRPGVQAAIALAQSTDATKWSKIDRRYSEMIRSTGAEKLEHLQKKLDDLAVRFKKASANRRSNSSAQPAGANGAPDDAVLSREEFMSVIQWKFAKGKDRSAFLMKHLNQNTDVAIQDAISNAFEIADTINTNTNTSTKHKSENNTTKQKIEKSIKAITILKGVGPATASAFLCLYRPDQFCFMDDEVIETFCGKRVYTLKVYMEINNECRRIAGVLGEDYCWSVYRVGRALWTATKLSAFGCAYDDEKSAVGEIEQKAQEEEEESGGKNRSRKRRKKAWTRL